MSKAKEIAKTEGKMLAKKAADEEVPRFKAEEALLS